MTAVDLGQRRRLRRDRRRAEPRAGAAEHGEHGEDPPFEAGQPSAGIKLGVQRCGVPYGVVGSSLCPARTQGRADGEEEDRCLRVVA